MGPDSSNAGFGFSQPLIHQEIEERKTTIMIELLQKLASLSNSKGPLRFELPCPDNLRTTFGNQRQIAKINFTYEKFHMPI